MAMSSILIDPALTSALNWWAVAGVDSIVEDRARDWLAAGHSPDRPAASAIAATALSAPPQTHDNLAALQRHLESSDDPAIPAGPRVAGGGSVASGLMVMVDMPEALDAASGMLLSGDAGLLFDRMLAAIGRDRASIYLAALSPARFPGGSIDPAVFDALAALARRHVALAAPRRLLLLGQAANRAVLGTDAAASVQKLREFNHDGGKVQVVGCLHPRSLLSHPALKARAWADLRALMTGDEAA